MKLNRNDLVTIWLALKSVNNHETELVKAKIEKITNEFDKQPKKSIVITFED